MGITILKSWALLKKIIILKFHDGKLLFVILLFPEEYKDSLVKSQNYNYEDDGVEFNYFVILYQNLPHSAKLD